MRLADLKMDPDFKNLLPELDAETYTALERNILSNGMFNPIIVWNGFIVDGHNRYSICKAHRIEEVQTKPLNKKTKSEVMQWIVDNQFSKRNLKKSERISLLSKVEAQIAKEAKERQRQYHGNQYQSAVGSNLTQVQNEEKESGRTAEIMAKKLGVSKNTYKDMKTIVEKGTQEQIKRMDEGGKGNGTSTIAREIKDGVKDGERKCSKCGRILPISEFTNKKSRFACRECENERKRESARKNREKLMFMPDDLNPEVKVKITDDVIISKFKNVLEDARDGFEMLLKHEQHMTDSVANGLVGVIQAHVIQMVTIKERIKNETEG